MTDVSDRPPLRLGTRGSQLALYQARTVAARIQERAGIASAIAVIKTSGDRLADAPLSEVGGKRLFVKEIEDALLSGAIDLAVHSSKDLPATLPEGLEIGAVLPREDPRDALILRESNHAALHQLDEVTAVIGQSPRIGTSSVRRVAQLMRLWPGANFVPIRGNLDTRLRKLDAGEYDAIVLAAAGIRRLGYTGRISLVLPAEACIPAPGQGIIAVEVRDNVAGVRAAVSRISDPATAAALDAERAVVNALGGGCQMPLGALATPVDDELELQAVVISLDGCRAIRAQSRGRRDAPSALGRLVAERLLEQGAAEILEDVRRAQAPVEGLQP
jgi:hydroxymethylbilane synthase